MLPTARQLQDLLDSLQPKLLKAGFTNTLVGWHIWFTSDVSGFRHLFTVEGDSQAIPEADIPGVPIVGGTPKEVQRAPVVPPSSIVFNLLCALAELERLGEGAKAALGEQG